MTFTGTSATCNGIQAPSELYFPEKIALGDSQEMILTVRNSANVAYYRILCVSAYLNGSPLPEGMSGLNFCNTVPCSVGDVTDVKVIFFSFEICFSLSLYVIDDCYKTLIVYTFFFLSSDIKMYICHFNSISLMLDQSQL